MATPSLVKPPAPRGEVAVVIELDPNGNIVVHPDPFWVHKSEDEEVKWFCSLEHKHGDANNPCFTVDFKGNSPFECTTLFKGHHAHSGCARTSVQPDPNKLYKYSVTVGDKTLDPGGGVKP